MTMTIGVFTTAVLVVCVISIVLCVFLFYRCVSLECEAVDLKKEVAAKDDEVAAKDDEIDELKRCTKKLAKTNRLCINMYKAMRAELMAKAPYPPEAITRKLIDRSLRPLVWCKAGDDEWWTMVNAWRIHICKYSAGGGWCVYSVSERLKSNLDMVLPTLKEAKAEGRAWIVEQIYSMFNRDNQD
jgi:hypothetical protein